MKKFIKFLPLLCGLCFASACEREIVSSLDNSVDDRINTLIDSVYVKALKSSEYGWMASIGTAAGYYRFWMDFRDSNVVIMQTDNPMYESQYKGVPEASTYIFKALQRPTLIFDTYSYLSLINDPSPSISGAGSTNYKGLSTDFEFEVEKYENEMFYMAGRFNKVKAVLKKASEKEKDGVEAGLMMELPDQVATEMKNRYIKATQDGTEIVMKVYDNRRLYIFWYDEAGDKGEEKIGYYNVEVDGSRSLFFPEEPKVSIIPITGLHYDAAQGKYDYFSAADPSLLIDVDISYSPPSFPISKIFGYAGSGKVFDELHYPMGFASDLPSGSEAKSSAELMAKFLGAAILCLGYEINFYFTTSTDDNGESYTEWNIALQNITGIGIDLETQKLTASFPSAIYTFPVTVENNGLTFTTGEAAAMFAGASTYYERGITTQLVDNFKNKSFSIDWSEYQNSEGLVLDIISQDKKFVLPIMLSKR
jgi:hypothetical protein